MPKPNPLTQGVKSSVTVLPAPAAVTEKKPVSRAREGRVLVGGHFAPEVSIALKVIAAKERTTVQALLAEGMNTVFAKRGEPEIAELSVE